jgi:hypothetical protein
MENSSQKVLRVIARMGKCKLKFASARFVPMKKKDVAPRVNPQSDFTV